MYPYLVHVHCNKYSTILDASVEGRNGSILNLWASSDPYAVLDKCNFDVANKRYHVRTKEQVDGGLPFCDAGNDGAVNWNHILAYCRVAITNSAITNSATTRLPVHRRWDDTIQAAREKIIPPSVS